MSFSKGFVKVAGLGLTPMRSLMAERGLAQRAGRQVTDVGARNVARKAVDNMSSGGRSPLDAVKQLGSGTKAPADIKSDPAMHKMWQGGAKNKIETWARQKMPSAT